MNLYLLQGHRVWPSQTCQLTGARGLRISIKGSIGFYKESVVTMTPIHCEVTLYEQQLCERKTHCLPPPTLLFFFSSVTLTGKHADISVHAHVHANGSRCRLSVVVCRMGWLMRRVPGHIHPGPEKPWRSPGESVTPAQSTSATSKWHQTKCGWFQYNTESNIAR